MYRMYIAKTCYRTSNSTQDLKNFKQNLFHHIKDENINYVFNEGFLIPIHFPDNF